jgi:hypothetical protein
MAVIDELVCVTHNPSEEIIPFPSITVVLRFNRLNENTISINNSAFDTK